MNLDERLDDVGSGGAADDAALADRRSSARSALLLPVVPRRSLESRFGPRPDVDVAVEATLDPGAAMLRNAAWSPETRRAYQGSWARFRNWYLNRHHALEPTDLVPVDARGNIVDPLDAGPIDVENYISYLGAGDDHTKGQHLSSAYIERELAAITHAFTLNDITPPTRHPSVKVTLAGSRRTLGTAQRQAIPLRLEDLRRILNAMAIPTNRSQTHPVIRRDRALLALGWAAALRRDELVGIDVEHLTFTGDAERGGGVVIEIPRSKTDQEAAGQHVGISYSTQPSSCPVRAALALARIRKTGPLFVSTTRHGKNGGRLTGGTVNRIVKRNVQTILGYDPDDYTSHSLRAGLVTELRARGVDAADIMKQTRHRDTRMLHRYDRPADVLERPVLQGEWW